uniref:NADH dehydrogenase subunit 6 n=1 Tax=Tetrastichus howardi TaxID=2848231 RepID=A0A8F5GCP9_9HYME|nr:NADH dehydrogenase subunit 6 [Tetrastichus howardi]QXM14791.1 NADH dehydrogenase subunit 6 [Tetrastichus howardi]
MMMSIQLILLMILSIINLFINMCPSNNKIIHPIILSLILLLLLMSSSLTIELYYNMNWISYLMFLIMIGGLMIIFLYFTSFIGNMKMSLKWNYIIMYPMKIILMFMFMFLIFIYIKFNYPWYFISMDISNYMNFYQIKFNTMYMYMYNKNYSLLICMIYLLIMLMFIVKICINKKISLRKLN